MYHKRLIPRPPPQAILKAKKSSNHTYLDTHGCSNEKAEALSYKGRENAHGEQHHESHGLRWLRCHKVYNRHVDDGKPNLQSIAIV
jgi:hypothetical protein